jgi:hypothetical protein
MKLVRLIQMRLNETYSKVCIGKRLSDALPTQNGLNQGDSLPQFRLKYAIRKTPENHVGLKLNRTDQLLVYVNDVNSLGDQISTYHKEKPQQN